MRICTFIFILYLCYCTLSSFSQILLDFPCYSISSGELPNVLFEYDPITNQWNEVGVTGGTNIEAIAFDPVNHMMYAADGGTFGTIDAQTALFKPIGEVGIGNGEAGLIDLNDVDGLTYDPINQIMYATHRVGGYGPGTNDLLFQIDVASGQVVRGAMLDSNNNPVDYAVIPDVFDNSGIGEVYDVADIAYNSYRGWLFAIHNHDGCDAIVSELNMRTGQIEAIIYDTPDADLGGLGFTYLGELYATSGKNGSTQRNSNTFIFIDLYAGSTTTLTFIDENRQYTDFGAFDCFTAYVDLALKMEVDPTIQQPVSIGEPVSFIITIYNQGDFDHTNITITNYIPDGLSLVDNNWTDLGNEQATYLISEILKPGENTNIAIQFTVNNDFIGQSITNAAEILSFYHPIITDVNGNPIALPDWDSKPDNQNSELLIIDNEINGKGPNANQPEDEDDHDIAILQLNSLLANINIVPELCDRTVSGSIQLEILYDATPPFNYIWEDANGSIIHQNTTNNFFNAIYNQTSEKYYVTVTDQLNRKSIFKLVVPSLSNLNGNVYCENPCPKYLITPNDELRGTFQAQQLIEITGQVNKSNTAIFNICQ